jgi:hypothetical protein
MKVLVLLSLSVMLEACAQHPTSTEYTGTTLAAARVEYSGWAGWACLVPVELPDGHIIQIERPTGVCMTLTVPQTRVRVERRQWPDGWETWRLTR